MSAASGIRAIVVKASGIRAIVVKAVGQNLPQNTLNGQRPSLNTQNVLGRAGSRNSVSSVCREMRPGPVDQSPAGKKQRKGNRLADRERSHRGTRIAAQHLDAEAAKPHLWRSVVNSLPPRYFTTEHTETPFGRHRRRPEKSVLRTCRPCFRLIILILWGFIMLWGFYIGTLRSEVPYSEGEVPYSGRN